MSMSCFVNSLLFTAQWWTRLTNRYSAVEGDSASRQVDANKWRRTGPEILKRDTSVGKSKYHLG